MEELPFAPSAKKLRKARQKGEAPQSHLLTMAVSTMFTLCAIGFVHQPVLQQLTQVLQQGLEGRSMNCLPLIGWIVVVLITPWISVLVVTLLQTQGLFSWQHLKPKWRRRSSFLSWEQLGLIVIKLAILALALGFFLKFAQPCDLACTIKKLYQLALFISGVFVLLGLLDWRYRHWKFCQHNRMSASEKKEEQREEQTSKLTRQRRQQLQERE